jgi:lysophospholipase L1-like esterase
VFLPAALALFAITQPAEKKAFEFKDGDRIVWIGNTLVEREQRYGYWETALLAANADKRITVRNLGWSGDTVHAEARGRFDFANPDACFKQLVNLTLELKPTVIFICYGTNESFEGKEGLPKFEKGLEKLLDALKPANARIVLFTPLSLLKTEHSPDVLERNKIVEKYAEVIRGTAAKRELILADTHERVGRALTILDIEKYTTPNLEDFGKSELTLNGMHLTEVGYQRSARAFLRCLSNSEKEMETRDLEPLRKAVIAKNELFFHRWRPQNETYLFGFRKHEQGKNAKEVAEFDPLVAKAEEEIDKIRKTLK